MTPTVLPVSVVGVASASGESLRTTNRAGVL